MRPSPALIAVLLAALVGALPSPASAAPTRPKALLVGAAEDAAKDDGAIGADAKMSLAAPATVVIGGSLAPRGSDNPKMLRPTHSPTRFILDLGAAYRRSHRTRPVMDWFSIHPYVERSNLPPTFAHPKTTTISIADYGKLVRLLGQAFDGTRQRGSTLPILYDEFGVQTALEPQKRSIYTNELVPSARDAVDEQTQARYYQPALALAACQRN